MAERLATLEARRQASSNPACAGRSAGANAIIALRCADLSGRWEEFWEARSVG